MRIRIEVDDSLEENEVLIRCRQMDESVRRLSRLISEQSKPGGSMVFYKNNQEYYFPPERVLFFETGGERVFAHTASDAYLVKHRLCDLEEMLPRFFVRAAKSAIVNIRQIYSITRSLTSASLITFNGSHKQVYASRYYYKELQRRLQERSSYET
jgi:DNA-binding LytR/AlgR family response regulator